MKAQKQNHRGNSPERERDLPEATQCRAGTKIQVSRLSSQLWAQMGHWGLSPELGGRAALPSCGQCSLALRLDGKA